MARQNYYTLIKIYNKLDVTSMQLPEKCIRSEVLTVWMDMLHQLHGHFGPEDDVTSFI
jgi:hypothetical protein